MFRHSSAGRTARKVTAAGVVACALAAFQLCPQAAYAAGDPIAHWRFDDGSGTAPVDSGPNNITGTFMTPNPTWSTTIPPVSFTDPYSLNFSSIGDGVRFAWPSGLNFASNAPRSFSFWYKPTANGETAAGNFDRIISWDGDAFEIAGTFGNVAVHRLAFYDGSWRDTGFDMTVGTWYNIAFTYDGSNVHLYVSGVEKYSGASSGGALAGNMYVGVRHTGDEGINGLVDDVRIYDYALNSTQVGNIVAGSDNADAAPSTTSSASGGGGTTPVWLLNLRAQNGLTSRGVPQSSSSSSSAAPAELPGPAAMREPETASSSSVSSETSAPPPTPLQIRTCNRVLQPFGGNAQALERINKRLIKRLGFSCGR